MNKKIILCILDGWGITKNTEGNATRVATYFHELWNTYPHALLQASGNAVGLPDEQMGNSEVGHTTLGLGRAIRQDLMRINDAIRNGTLSEKAENFCKKIRENKGTAHVLGLISPGGVHSHIDHTLAVINILAEKVSQVLIHAILDGRDSPPRSAKEHLQMLQATLPPNARIVSACGRFWAMDRDNRWDRTEAAYRLIVEQNGIPAPSCDAMLECAYSSCSGDEFVPPFAIGDPYIGTINDGLIVTNFRADRIRQITQAIGASSFDKFDRGSYPRFASILTMTEYDSTFEHFCEPLFKKESVTNSLGQVLSLCQKRQIRIAESEKYAHVTYFFNGGVEASLNDEARVFIPSPKAITYEKTPAMSANAVTNEVIKAMQSGYDAIIVNYANADMLGHTGDFEAATQAVLVVDDCLKCIVESATRHGYTLFVVADHGNAEQMLDTDGSVHKMHTINPAPFIVLDKNVHLQTSGGLANVASTVLEYLEITPPQEMAASLFTN